MMSRYLLLLIVLLSGSALAQVQRDPMARPFDMSEEGSDPLFEGELSSLENLILMQVDSKHKQRYHAGESAPQLLTMIIQTNGDYVAYIGSKAVRVGDTVGVMRVVKITQHEVTLDDGQNKVTLHIAGFKKHEVPLK